MAFDVIAVGNATIDAFLRIHDANSHFQLNSNTNQMCMRSGDKIEVEKTDFCLGGNAANTIVGIARLGLRTALCAEIGNDEFSDKILKILHDEKVDFRLMKRGSAATSFTVAISFQGERTLFVQHVTRNHYFDFTDVETKWIYLTSLGEEWKEAYQKTLMFVKDSNCKLALSPGVHQLKQKEEVIQKALEQTDILFVNKEEGIQIASSYRFFDKAQDKLAFSFTTMENLLDVLHQLGPKMVVITDGEKGSFVIDDKGKKYSQGIIEAAVVEKTGAGDSYAAAFLSAIINGKNIEKAMEWGAKNSASVIGKVGAQEGLLRKEEIERSR